MNNKLRQAGPNIHPPEIQAQALSLQEMAEGGDVDQDDGLMDQVCDELMHAFDMKDKSLLMDALKALILHIQDEDQEQDQGEQS